MTISLRLNNEDAALIRKYADMKGISVSENGEFTILCSYKFVSEILQAVYGEKEIHAESDGNLLEYPYIAIKVTSPDGKQTLTVPLLLYGVVTGIELNPSEVIF